METSSRAGVNFCEVAHKHYHVRKHAFHLSLHIARLKIPPTDWIITISFVNIIHSLSIHLFSQLNCFACFPLFDEGEHAVENAWMMLVSILLDVLLELLQLP